MLTDPSVLLSSPLFQGLSTKDTISLLQCISVNRKKFSQGEVIFLSGEPINRIGVILQGSITIIKEDFSGNRSILAEFVKGNIFGEAFAFSNNEKLSVTAISASESEILFIDANRIFTFCASACPYHSRLIENMLKIIAKKNIVLNEKIDVLSKRTIRNRLLSFLQIQSQKNGSNHFSILFNRQELADYLCVDRSALSNEMSKLQNEGFFSVSKNEFTIYSSKGNK
jgi:CRP-like cAMP-binding protein